MVIWVRATVDSMFVRDVDAVGVLVGIPVDMGVFVGRGDEGAVAVGR